MASALARGQPWQLVQRSAMDQQGGRPGLGLAVAGRGTCCAAIHSQRRRSRDSRRCRHQRRHVGHPAGGPAGPAIHVNRTGHPRVGQTAGRIILPSTHAANAFAFAAAVGTICPGLSVVLVPLAAAIGVARVGIAHHYPADVVAGALTGAGIGTAIGLFVRRRYPRSSPLESPTSPLPRTGLSVADPRGRDPRPPVAYDERTDQDRTRLDAG